jgi:para-nitrobenzyl esterase
MRHSYKCWLRIAASILVSAGFLLSSPPAQADHGQDGQDGQGSPNSNLGGVTTQNGLVQGVATSALDEFLGIPYAAPPVGPLRWQPPQPAPAYTGVLQATQFGSSCPQVATPFGKPSVDENCLFLNVFTPARPHGKLPVMVYFHGGDFVVGEGSDYNPTSLVDNGNVIVVTVNYRLGVFGFLADPALSSEQPDHASGNYGLMDQQAALRWVQANIAAFGGNSGNVTIFGQSAGGDSVVSQLTSPTAAGLFQRAIVESGSYNLTPPTLAQSEAYGAAFAASVGCASNTASCLRNLTTAQLVAASAPSFGLAQLESLGPNIGGSILPLSPAAAFASGQFNRVPVINGTNGNEGSLFIALAFDLKGGPLSAAEYPTAVQALVGHCQVDEGSGCP